MRTLALHELYMTLTERMTLTPAEQNALTQVLTSAFVMGFLDWSMNTPAWTPPKVTAVAEKKDG